MVGLAAKGHMVGLAAKDHKVGLAAAVARECGSNEYSTVGGERPEQRGWLGLSSIVL